MKRFFIKYGMLTVIVALMAAAGWGLAYAVMEKPGPVTVDCRGKQIEVETLRQWEEQEKDGYLGLVGIAGWRVEGQRTVTSISTGRSHNTRVTGIYGSMELVYPMNVLSGTCGLAVEDGWCVLTEGLAYELFGDTDIAGELCRFDGMMLTVAGVIEKKEKELILPISQGPVEHLSLQFKSGWKVKEKVRELLGEV